VKEEKRRSLPDINVFTDHIHRSIEEAKKRKEGERGDSTSTYLEENDDRCRRKSERRFRPKIVAPWPGFEPGSGGRQPPILGRAILPGQTSK